MRFTIPEPLQEGSSNLGKRSARARAGVEGVCEHMRRATVLGIVGRDGKEVQVDRLDVVAVGLRQHVLEG